MPQILICTVYSLTVFNLPGLILNIAYVLRTGSTNARPSADHLQQLDFFVVGIYTVKECVSTRNKVTK